MNKTQEIESVQIEETIEQEVLEAIEYNRNHHLGKLAVEEGKNGNSQAETSS